MGMRRFVLRRRESANQFLTGGLEADDFAGELGARVEVAGAEADIGDEDYVSRKSRKVTLDATQIGTEFLQLVRHEHTVSRPRRECS